MQPATPPQRLTPWPSAPARRLAQRGLVTNRRDYLAAHPGALAFAVYYPHAPAPLVLCPTCALTAPLPPFPLAARYAAPATSVCARCDARLAPLAGK